MGKEMKIFFVVVIFIIVAGVGIYFAKNKTSNQSNNSGSTSEDVKGATTISQVPPPAEPKETDIILFYGSTCPHCKKVGDFISQNQITKYLKFQNLEVYNNQDNLKLMMDKQSACKNLSDNDKGGVPFLYSGEKCVIGDAPVIDFLKEKAGLN